MGCVESKENNSDAKTSSEDGTSVKTKGRKNSNKNKKQAVDPETPGETSKRTKRPKEQGDRFSLSCDKSVMSEGYTFTKEEQCKALFDEYDIGKTGMIARVEMEKVLGVGDNVAQLILCQIGQRSTDGVTYAEFRRFYEMSDARTPVSVKIKLLFEGIDFNGDGCLDEDEVARYLSAITPGSTPDQFAEFALETVRGRGDKTVLMLEDFDAMREEFKLALRNIERLGELLRHGGVGKKRRNRK